MASVFKFFMEEFKGASSISSTSGNSTSTEEEGTSSLNYVEGHKDADKRKTKILSNSDHHKNIPGKRSNLKDESKKGSQGTSKNRTKSENVDSVRTNDSGTVTYLKAEYRILNITTTLKEMTQNYDYTPTPFDPLSPLESSSGHSSKSSSSTCMSQDNFVEESKTIKDSDNNRIHQEIKEEMYKQLCAVHEIVKVEPVLEQYVLRELRHLQEYLCLRYPPIMSYLKDQFDEIIECTRAKTRGLSIASPDPRNKPNSIQIQSMPSPMKIASPAKECNAPSPQVSTTSDTGTSRGTNRERSTTSSSISSMPPKKQNKSNTTGDFSMSSSDLDTSEDDEEEQHDKI